jgi:hypothetical protein
MDVSSLSSTAVWQSPGTSSSAARGPEKTNKAVADLLGMSTDDLRTALQSGKTMADLATSAGVSEDNLESTIAGTLPATGPDGVSATDMAAKIATGHGPHGPQGPPPAKPDADAAGGLDALSSALGVSSSELRDRLTDGSGISDLLSANPDVAAQLTASQNKGAIVDGYA